MKTTTAFLLIFSVSILFSCDKEEAIETMVYGNVFDVTIKNSLQYRYTFEITGDEEGVTIIVPASHARTCEIIRNEETSWKPVFQYQPKENFTGPDMVKIETCTGSDGTVCNQLDTLIFTFNVIK